MAESTTRWVLSINMLDGIDRPCGSTFYVSQTDAAAYNAAADDAARALTAVGILITRYVAMSDAVLVSANVGKEVIVEPAAAVPANTVMRGNKLQFTDRHAGRTGVFNIPARKAAAFTQDSGSIEVSITTPTAMSNFVAQYNLVAKDPYGNAATIRAAKVVD